MGERIALVGKLTDQTDILLNIPTILLHLPQVVLAPLALQPTHYLLVLLHNLQQLPLTVRLVQCLLLVLAQILVHPRVRSLAT